MQVVFLLTTFAVVFLLLGYYLKSWQVIGYSLVCVIVLATLLFFRDNPNTRVSTPYITLEQQIKSIDSTLNKVSANQQDIAVTQKQLQNIVTTLTKMILVVEDGVGKLGDTRPQRDKLLQEYKKQIQSLIPKEFSKDLNRDIETLYKSP